MKLNLDENLIYVWKYFLMILKFLSNFGILGKNALNIVYIYIWLYMAIPIVQSKIPDFLGKSI